MLLTETMQVEPIKDTNLPATYAFEEKAVIYDNGTNQPIGAGNIGYTAGSSG